MTGRREIYHMLMSNKKDIIQKYNSGMKVPDIARVYDVAVPTIYVKLKQWKGEIKRREG